jgi:Mg2+/Co2+ transporter CorB
LDHDTVPDPGRPSAHGAVGADLRHRDGDDGGIARPLHRLAGEGDRRAALVTRLLNRKECLIGALLLGNNLLNVMATALAAAALIHLLDTAGVAWATLLMAVLLVVVPEALPKTYAIRCAASATKSSCS